MRYLVRSGDSLWSISQVLLGDGSKWPQIARVNRIANPNRIFVGQELQIPDRGNTSIGLRPTATRQTLGVGDVGNFNDANRHNATGKSNSLVPATYHVFVLADEVNPLSQKIVRRVIVNPKMAAEAAANLGRPISVFPNPERFGFQPTGPESKVPPGRHAQGLKPSPFTSASNRAFGASRFLGKPFWIDVDKAKASGATIHSTEEILSDLDRIAAKARTDKALQVIEETKKLVVADKEILVRRSIPANAVKGTGAMALTRGLQGVQIVGFGLTAVNLTHAAQKSINTNSVKPITAETVRQVGGWASAWAGVKLGGAGGALIGIETGPGAVLTAGVGAIAGGFAGYFGFDWIADHIDEN